jgi:zinc transport system ATP-binding protein
MSDFQENNYVLSIKDMSFSYSSSYSSVPVLENVNLSIEQGQFLSIIGPNGGGKTTLLKLILGLLKPDIGEIKVFGKTPEHVRHRVGYIPQFQFYDPQFPVTVVDVVLMGRLGNRWGFFSTRDREKALSSLNTVGLEHIAERSFTQLSGGQRQRVLIARALASEPEMLILDEPAASVDASSRVRLTNILQQLNEDMTILLTTHDVGFVTNVVNGVVCVNRRVVFHPTDKIDGTIIKETYGTEMNLVRHDIYCTGEDLHNE